MKLIIGLGNPGDKYAATRHNIGFMVVDKLVKDKLSLLPSLKAWKEEKKFSSHLCRINDLIIAKPQTFMNRSGVAVLSIVNFFKVPVENVWVVHDDIDLPIGKVRIRAGGGSAGHNGIESIIDNLHSPDFVRFRLGIGRGKLNLKNTSDQNLHRREIERHVLEPFRENEVTELKHLLKKATESIELALTKGLERVMNEFN